MNVWLKYAITAAVVVLAFEAAKRSDRLGGLVASLPLVTLLTLVWLHVERQNQSKYNRGNAFQDYFCKQK